MTELDQLEVQESLSRSQRKGTNKRQSQPLNEEFKENLLATKVLPAILWSLFLSLASVANPYLTTLATNIQTQDLYAGMAMQMGQHPYGNFFGTSGLLYYLLTSLGSLFTTTWVFVGLQFIALLIAGIYFYKLVAYFTKSESMATSYSHWFYLFLWGIGFGGLYAALFALPFILTSIWFLVRYFENAVRDEAFILYGIDAALVFLIYPKSLLLWLVAGLVLLIFNSHKRQMARGIYQLLASIFGFLLILYAVGYYAFEAQILGTAIQQTFLYSLRLNFSSATLGWTLLLLVGFLTIAGFWKNVISTLLSYPQKQHTYIKTLLLLVFLVHLVFIIGTSDFQWAQLISLLPYGFLLGATHWQVGELEEEEPTYLRQHYFLPLLVCLAIVAQPTYTYLIQGDLLSERETVATYVAEQTQSSDKIYVWDTTAHIYLASHRLSAATITTAQPYLDTETNRSSLTFDLNKNEAAMIVVNKNIPLLDGLSSNLSSSYEQIQTSSNFIIYKKK